MPRIEATPTPELLRWSREKAGYSEQAAAEKIGVAADRLSNWESGTERPTFAQLRSLGDIYKRPIAVFYLPEPPTRFEALKDFRRGHPSQLSMSPELALEIRRAYDRREWAIELLAELGEGAPRLAGISLTLRSNMEQSAEVIRKALGARLDTQSTWRTDYDAFRNWRELVENAGILTFQATTLDVEEARGFSLPDAPFPVAVANIKDSPRGRLFTLLHEVVHIFLRQSGVCDLHEQGRARSDMTESYCNRVAGAVLFPREALMASDTVRRHSKSDPAWTDEELATLSRRFGGSREAALVRLLTLGLTTQAYYQEKREEFFQKYLQAKKVSGGFAPPHIVALASVGPRFAGLVVESFNREKITASDVADYLQIRLKHLQEVQREYSSAVA